MVIKILLFIIFIASTTALTASQQAEVMVDKAILYADMELLSPIGYTTRGKEVTVGSVMRKRGSVLPIIVNKKICYIKVADLRLKSDVIATKKKKSQEHKNSTN